jgi:hypothetical protein
MLWILSALAADPIAVVELFTSQGCSSCPPADAALADLAAREEKAGRPVYAVSFHVDYWDRLGWTDPYSDARWTGRQRAYARTWQAERVYTPQAVVNGTTAFVGSKRDRLQSAVATALEKPAVAQVGGKARKTAEGVHVEVSATGAPLGAQLYVVVAEKERHNRIPKGENARTTGTHRNVARAMMKTDAPGGQGVVAVPVDFDWDQATVFAWVADPLTLEIVGAARLPLTD